jgi:hypothetical protein
VVEVRAGGVIQVREINNVASYQSANDVRLHIGLGSAKAAERVEVRWPGGATQALTDVQGNQVMTVEEP